MKNPKFQLFKSSRDKQYYFHFRAGNGEIILTSEGYKSRNGLAIGLGSVKINSLDTTRYQRRDKPGNYTFNLKAANGEIIGRSESYTTRAARQKGILALRRDAPFASVEDLTGRR